ncbi:MAG: alpha/beta hydrolase [Gemmatimonadetes bacterium]|nr:alpha/beta hydrolase [Gemmatimonadota bacterium]
MVVPGARDVRGSLDGPTEGRGCVVACPPHPQAGGTRSNPVLTAVGEALAERGLATLRFDYGPWDEGDGEVTDAVRAARWAAERYPAVGLFGYSFGATIALAAAAEVDAVAVSALAPASRLPSLDTVGALEAVGVPVQLLYGERDRVVDSEPVAERARELGHEVAALPADHHFVGQRGKVAERVAGFLEGRF